MPSNSVDNTKLTTPQVLVIHAGYEGFVLIVGLIMLINSALLALPFDEDTHAVAWLINALLSAFLLLDAGWRTARNRARLRWLLRDYGWLTWLGSLPAPFFSLGRLAAFGLATRRLHRADLTAAGVNIVTRRAQSVLLVVLLAAIIVFEVSSILVLRAENASPDANILTAYDALWWGYVTMATVGYGDRYPVTDAGRLVGIAVMTVGVAIFSVLTSFLADWFRRPHTTSTARRIESAATDDVHALLADIRRTLDDKAQADQLALDELRARFDELERRLR
jgi:voltage-gated potassium channel